MRAPRTAPPSVSRRPPEPIRPELASRPGTTLLAARARRQRHRHSRFR